MSEAQPAVLSPYRFLPRSLVVDVALPWLTFVILERYGVPTVWALVKRADEDGR